MLRKLLRTGRSPRRALPGAGAWQQRVRLYSGLILFAFASTHLVNHALGLVSLDAMDAMRDIRVYFWRSAVGTLLLYGALVLHGAFSLYKFLQRRTWRMTLWEGLQLAFGLAIPLLLLRHIIGTRLLHQLFGLDDNYTFALYAMWPGEAYNQAVLILLVWVHGCLGLHFWMRMKPWYVRMWWALYAIAVMVPVLAYAGFAVGGRHVRVEREFQNTLSSDQIAFAYETMDRALWACIAILAAALAFRLTRSLRDRFRPTVKVAYADGRTVTSEIGPTLLEISRSHGIPHASVCGGRARCSTCRVRVLDGLEDLPEAEAAEAKVLDRVGAGANVRLACQLVPRSDMSVATLLPARQVTLGDLTAQDKYLWGVEQSVAIMFADIRGFTALSENKLPYDVVFVLNQYLGQMSDAISDAGGYVDKFIGDGIMAIFGMEEGPRAGARHALDAARAMGGVLSALNNSLAADLDEPLNIGIGIHTGSAILGRIGVSGASGATQRITALGDTVNTASRLEASCKELACQLVVSESTIRATELEISGGERTHISVKGREEQVLIRAFKQTNDVEMMVSVQPARA